MADPEPSAFVDKSKPPKERELAEMLGARAPLWNELKAQTAAKFPPLAEEWTFAGSKRGWSLRLKQKKRAVLYMTPLPGRFRAAFALGEKAVAAARAARLPASIWKVIDEAPRYVEGRAVVIEVRKASDVAHVLKVAGIKMSIS